MRPPEAQLGRKRCPSRVRRRLARVRLGLIACTVSCPAGKITLRDLKSCRLAHVFFDTFFNIEKYLDHEQKEQVSLLRVSVARSAWGAGRAAPRDARVLCRRATAKAPSCPTGRSTRPRSTTSWWPRRLQGSRGRTGEWGTGRGDGQEAAGGRWAVGASLPRPPDPQRAQAGDGGSRGLPARFLRAAGTCTRPAWAALGGQEKVLLVPRVLQETPTRPAAACARACSPRGSEKPIPRVPGSRGLPSQAPSLQKPQNPGCESRGPGPGLSRGSSARPFPGHRLGGAAAPLPPRVGPRSPASRAPGRPCRRAA